MRQWQGMGTFWVTTTDSGLFRSVRPFRDFLDGGKLRTFSLEPAYSEKNAMDHIVEFRGVVSVNSKLAIYTNEGLPIYTVRKSKD